MQNEFCPITLESLLNRSESEVFCHADVGFDVLALYEYLLTAPTFVNPVNRIPFAISDLQLLEQQIETLFGTGCILRDCDPDDEIAALDGQSNDGDGLDAESDDGNAGDDEEDTERRYNTSTFAFGPLSPATIDWLDDTELISRLSTSITHDDGDRDTGRPTRVIRLQVDIDVQDAIHELQVMPHPSTSPMASLPVIAEEDDEDDYTCINQDMLPPRRTFPSVVDMYNDTGRERRISDQLSMLQFLEHDAMSVLISMLDMYSDANFHHFVWQHTSLDVMDVVTTYLTRAPSTTTETDTHHGNVSATSTSPASRENEQAQIFTHIVEPRPRPSDPADYELEVVYTDCWEIYRTVILHNLQRRYFETARDILVIGIHDFNALLACHRVLVQQRAHANNMSYHLVLEFLDEVEGELTT